MPRAQKRPPVDWSSSAEVKETSHPADQITALPVDFEPGPYDVICARGNAAAGHPGYVRYRHYIDQLLEEYNTQATTKLAKSMIVSRVVEFVRQKTAAGFVKKIQGRWYRVSDSFVREKIGQTFRDALHFKYRSSNKAKKCRKRQDKEGLGQEANETKPRRFSSASSSGNSHHTQESVHPPPISSSHDAAKASTRASAETLVRNTPMLLQGQPAAMGHFSEQQKQQFALYQRAELMAQHHRLQQLQQQQQPFSLYPGQGLLGMQQQPQHRLPVLGVSPHLLHSLRQEEAARLAGAGAGWTGPGAPTIYAHQQLTLSGVGPVPPAESNKAAKLTPDGTDALIAALQQKVSSNESTTSSRESAGSPTEEDGAVRKPAAKKARLANDAPEMQREAPLLGPMQNQQYGGLPGNVYVVMPGSGTHWQQKQQQHVQCNGFSSVPLGAVKQTTDNRDKASQEHLPKASGALPGDATVVAASSKRVSAVSDEESVETHEDRQKNGQVGAQSLDWLSKVQTVGGSHVVMPVAVFQELLRKLECTPEAGAAPCSSSSRKRKTKSPGSSSRKLKSM